MKEVGKPSRENGKSKLKQPTSVSSSGSPFCVPKGTHTPPHRHTHKGRKTVAVLFFTFTLSTGVAWRGTTVTVNAFHAVPLSYTSTMNYEEGEGKGKVFSMYSSRKENESETVVVAFFFWWGGRVVPEVVYIVNRTLCGETAQPSSPTYIVSNKQTNNKKKEDAPFLERRRHGKR